MNFVYPLGLLGLIGIPVLILIYIIKNRYTEQTIPSTYIWNLSERFLKRRVPISKLVGILSLILQILIVIFISFAMAHPVITIANSASSYCFVLDGSGSMNFVQKGETRFEIAKGEIESIINKSMRGSDYTLIYVGSSTETIYEGVTDKKSAKQILKELEGDYLAVDIADARSVAQNIFNENPSVQIYLFTDKDYTMYSNVKLVNVSDATENYAVTNVSYGLSEAQFKVSGTAISYETPTFLTVELYFDGEETPSYTNSDVYAGLDGADFEFVCPDRTGFASFKVVIADKDNLPLDNEVTIFNVTYENVSDVLLVSDTPFFIRAALTAAGIGNIDIRASKDYVDAEGYGLYIFDSFTPETLPADGAVWFFNPQASVAGANFSYQTLVESPHFEARYSSSTETLVNNLLEGVSKMSFWLSQYVKCGMSAKFTPIITCEGNPLLFVGNNAYGNREVVFAFDVHDSAQFTLMGDFSTLVKNLISYSFPSVIDETFYYSGESMLVNVVLSCNSIRIETPSGKTSYGDTSSATFEYQLGEVGIYKIVFVLKDGSERVFNVFSAMPEEERETFAFGVDFSVNGVAQNEKYDGYTDLLLYLFIALVVLAVADYGVYCYEQYQLR